jgi:hypothetical protein
MSIDRPHPSDLQMDLYIKEGEPSKKVGAQTFLSIKISVG